MTDLPAPVDPSAAPSPAAGNAAIANTAFAGLRAVSPSASAWPDFPGYELIRLVGEGGMGRVFQARNRRTGELVAVKTLRRELGRSADAAHLFWRGVGFKRRLSHPHIMSVLEAGEGEAGPFLVMPWMPGGTLAERIRGQGPLPGELVRRIGTQLAEALEFVHRHGVVHHDVQPSNVLFDALDNVRLSDFGIARRFLGDSVMDLPEVRGAGTAAYLSPALAAGEEEDTRCDIYAFGAVLYEMLTGTPPYEGQTVQSILQQVQAGSPRPILEVHPAADAELARIASRAMARTQRERYACMRDVLDELAEASLGPVGMAAGRSRPGRWAGLAWAGAAATAALALAGLLCFQVPEDRETRLGTLFADDFANPAVNRSIWSSGHTTLRSRAGQGVASHVISQDHGTLLIESRAQEEQGSEVRQYAMLDSVVDLRSAGEVLVEVDLEVTVQNASAWLMVVDDEATPEAGLASGVALWSCHGSKAHPRLNERRQLRLEFSPALGAASVQETGPDGATPLRIVGLSGLGQWRLRFCAEAMAAALMDPDCTRVRLHQATASVVRRPARVLGWLTNAVSAQPAVGVRLRNRSNGSETTTTEEGAFLLPARPGANEIEVLSPNYRLAAPPWRIEAQRWQTVLVRAAVVKHRPEYGDPKMTIAELPQAAVRMAVGSGALYYLRLGDPAVLLRQAWASSNALPLTQCAAYAGLAWAEGRLLAVGTYDRARVFELTAGGQTVRRCSLPTLWPAGLAWDGNWLWFIEHDNLHTNRLGVYAIDPRNGSPQVRFGAEDWEIHAIASRPGRLWIASGIGIVYEVDPRQAQQSNSLERGTIRTFRGRYADLCWAENRLLALSSNGHRVFQLDLDAP